MGTRQEENYHRKERVIFDPVAEHDGCDFWGHLSMEAPVSPKHWIQTRAKK